MKLNIQKATKTDGKQIALLLAEAYQSLDSSISSSVRAFHSECDRGYHYIIAKNNGEIVGLAAWFYHGLPKHGLIEIDRYAVRSDLRRRGTGREIFRFLVKDANKFFVKYGGLRKIFLFTREENKIAHRFYKSLGFTREAKVKKHFYANKDDLIFSYFIQRGKK
jgi:ribosomal protein S18 acetylase RimI-like enzyme